MRDAPKDGRKALKMLRDYFAGKGKPWIINLYSSLTSLRKASDENITSYIIKVEAIFTALHNAGEMLGAGLLVAIALNGDAEIICFRCGSKGHLPRGCGQKV